MNRKYQILGSRAPSVPAASQTQLKTSVKSGASIALALFCLAAGGCGQKGPLYLPAPPASPASSPDTLTAPSTDSR